MADSEQLETRIRSVMEDPSAQVIARTYANAFLNAATAANADEPMEEFQSFVSDVLEPNPQFSQMLLSEFVKPEEKLEILDRVLESRGSEFFKNFLRVLTRHGRLDLLPVILQEAHIRYEQNDGRGRVQIRSAQALSDERRHHIYEQLNASLSYDPILEFEIDASLMGGLVIQIGDTVYDSSLRTRLRQLRTRLRERNLNEIQSRRDRFSHPEGD